jgi:hypothetical protein
MAAFYADFWGSGGYSLLNNRRPGISQLFVRVRNGKTAKALRDQIVDLITASGSTTGSVTNKRVQQVDSDAGQLGGVRTIESQTITTLAANSTSNSNTINEIATMKTRPSFPADLSGNGGPALT